MPYKDLDISDEMIECYRTLFAHMKIYSIYKMERIGSTLHISTFNLGDAHAKSLRFDVDNATLKEAA